MAFGFYRTVTIAHGKCGASDSLNFPMLFSSTHVDLKSAGNGGHVQSASGYDIAFYSDTALTTALPFELQSYVASTGAVVAWVKVPTVSHTVNTVVYVAYGDAGITTDQSSTSTWDANYKGVYHLDDNAATTVVRDSTSNAANATNAANTSTKTIAAQIGNGLSYNGTSDKSQTTVAGTTAFTWEVWVDNTAAQGSNNYGTIMSMDGANFTGMDILSFTGTDTLRFFSPDGLSNDQLGAGTVTQNTLYRFVLVRTANSGLYIFYSNGATTGNKACTTFAAGNNICIGARPDTATQYYKGILDEVRISNIARGADWILTDYNSQSDPASFYTLGSEVAITLPARHSRVSLLMAS